MAYKAICGKSSTHIPDDEQRKYPYLPCKLTINYVPMSRGHTYLYAVTEWHSHKVPCWAVSNTMGTGLFLEAQEKTLD